MKSSWRTGLCMLALASACTSDTHGIQVQSVDLAAGRYSGLQWAGTQVERFYVLANRQSDEDGGAGDLVIVAPEHEAPCSLGSDQTVAGLLVPQLSGVYAIGAPSPARIPLLQNVDRGFGTLNFSDIDCQPANDIRIDNAQSPLTLHNADYSQMTFVVLTGDGTLEFVDPWKSQQNTVATDIIGATTTGSALWSVGNQGPLIKRDMDGSELLRAGEDVDPNSFRVYGEESYTYVDAHGLTYVREGVRLRLNRNGCSPQSVDGFLPGAVAYYSPCNGNNLVVHTNDNRNYAYASGVDDRLFGFGGRLIYTVTGNATTRVWMVQNTAPDAPVMVFEAPRFKVFGVSPLSDDLIIVSVQDLSSNTYLLWSVDLRAKALTRLAWNLSAPPSIFNNSNGTSSISLLDQDQTLTVLDRTATHVLFSAAKVTRAHYVFNEKSVAVAYISNFVQDQGGRLELQILSGGHFVIDDNVTEYDEVYWPERGLVYATAGSDPHMRFARVDIPCQTTADNPWTCGF